MSTDKHSIEWYDQHAAEYTQHVRNPDESVFHSLYEKPAMYDLLPDLHGISVIGLGCGSGEDCHYLSKQGATRVVGVDISDGLVKVARESYPECEFHVMDMEQLTFDDSIFDFAYSSLAIHYIEDWSEVFNEVYRVLKPNSHFLFSCGHPVYSAMETIRDDDEMKVQELSRTKNVSTKTVKIAGDYLGHRPLGGDAGFKVTTWHKPISEISKEAVGAGFLIAEICEPKPLAKMKEVSLIDYDTLIKIPDFIIFKLWKQ